MSSEGGNIFNAMEGHEDDDDDISLNSTLVSDVDPEQTYIVDKIRAEKTDPNDSTRTLYLVEWEGYPIERATWEPAANFDNQDMINQWNQAKSAGGCPPFDWRKWDRDRERERNEQKKRKMARALKRERVGWRAPSPLPSPSPPPPAPVPRALRSRRESRRESRRTSRASSSSNASRFVVPDDVIEMDDSDELPDDQPRTGGGPPLSSERRKSQRNKRHRLVVEDEDEDEDEDGNDSDRTADSLMENLTTGREKPQKKRRTKPKERATTTAKEQVKEKEGAKPLQRRARKTEIARVLPARKRARSKSPAEKRPLVPGARDLTFRNFAEMNRVSKRARNEPEPDFNALKLVKAGEEPLRRPAALRTNTEARSTANVDLITSAHVTEGSPYASRKRPLSPGNRSIPLSPPAQSARPMISPNRSPPHKRVAADPSYDEFVIHQAIEDMTMQDVSPVLAAPPPPHLPQVLECEVLYGPANNVRTMGTVRFLGFKPEFMQMINKRSVQKLWISKYLEDKFIRNYLRPTLGAPQEVVDLEILGDYEPVVNALAIVHGAGVITDEAFTLLVFQPTNDEFRKLFVLSQQKQKAPLRAVAYPPFSLQMSVAHSVPELRSPFDQGFEHYLPNLLYRFLGAQCAQMVNVPENRPAFCTVYAPKCLRSEQYELETALKMLNHNVVNYEQALEHEKLWKESREKISMRVFVHHALRRQLHILPYIDLYRKARDVAFWFFGTSYVPSSLDSAIITKPVRFWLFGTLILVTPQLVINHPKVLSTIKNYQAKKAGSTWICAPATLCAQVEAYAYAAQAKSSVPQAELEDMLKAAWDLEDRAKSGDVLELPVGDVPDGANAFEVLVDSFVLYQIENCTRYRRFVVAHSSDESTVTVREKLYSCIEFLPPEASEREFHMSFPAPKRISTT